MVKNLRLAVIAEADAEADAEATAEEGAEEGSGEERPCYPG